MWESIFLTLAATAGNNIGKILQKKGTVILRPLSLKLKVIRAYALNRAWLIGFLMDIFGALLMLRALSLAPVSVIQPVSGCGLAILSIFSHFYLKEIMNVVDWMGITLAGIGTIGNELVLEGRSKRLLLYRSSIFHGTPEWLATHLQTSTKRTGVVYRWNMKLLKKLYGLESGILFGMASVISKMGFVFLEQGFPGILVPICLIISICCSGTGFYYQTWGLKHGRAIVVSTCAAVASIVTGVLAGMLALGERLPSAPTAHLTLMLGWVFIMVGVILLVSSTRLVRFLPRALRHVDKNFSVRKSGSTRARESNPSTVIQASTLHQLMHTSSKEKA